MDKLPDIEQFAVDRLPSIEQFAVPAAIPASAPKRPPRAQPPQKSMAQTVFDPIQSFLRGTGQAASLGLAQYPAALGIQATRAVTGGAPLSFSEALQEVKQQNRQFQQENPTASTLGQLAGIVPTVFTGGAAAGGIPLVRSLTVGAPSTGIAAMTGRGALYGGVQGFTEEERLADALKGAAVGATASGVLGAAGKYGSAGAAKLAENATIKDIINFSKRSKEFNKKAKEYMFDTRVSKKEQNTPMTEQQVRELYSKISKDKSPEVQQAKAEILKDIFPEAVKSGFQAGTSSLGAIAGLGLGSMTDIQDPFTLALLAGGGALLAPKAAFAQEFGKTAAMKLAEANLATPGIARDVGARVGEAAGRALTTATGPVFGEPGQMMGLPPLAIPSRLQQLADDFRQRTGGQ